MESLLNASSSKYTSKPLFYYTCSKVYVRDRYVELISIDPFMTPSGSSCGVRLHHFGYFHKN